MAIKAAVKSTSGINVNSGANSYLKTRPEMFSTATGNFGYFYDNLNAASEYGLALEEEGSVFTGGSALLAKGLLRYDLSKHVVTGRLDSIAFGEELNGVAGSFGVTSTKMSLGSTDITFSGLGLDASDGDNVNGILYGVMTGDATLFLKYLATNAVTFTGGKGNDTYVAGNKTDVLNGEAGNDRLSGGAGNDKINGGAGNDVISATTGNDTLVGASGADTLSGGAGNDKLTGGGGADKLTGGGGKDHFIFTRTPESTAKAFDTIIDFARGDKIDLSSIDADTKHARAQDFDFIGSKAFSHTAGELRFERSSGGTDVYADTNGDGKTDFAIHLDTSIKLVGGDFLL